MKFTILFILSLFFFCSCLTSRKINYSFESSNVADSIISTLKKYENIYQRPYQQTKWFVLLRQPNERFELIISEKLGDAKSPINILIKKSNRYLLVDKLKIPILFESDLISSEMRDAKVGYVNWGGYYFEILKENYYYKVVKTAVLF